MSELLSIGEFARRSALSVSAVRFYADRGVLTPAETDAGNGYRYFAESQLTTACLIRDLRRIEMPLATVRDVLDMSPPDRQSAVIDHLARLDARLRHVHALARDLSDAPEGDDVGDGVADGPGGGTSRPTTIVRSAELAAGLAQVIPMAGRDAMRPHLMSVLLEAREGSVRLVATDSYRLAVRDLMPSSSGEQFSAVVAAATVQMWPTDLAHDGLVEIGVDGGELVVRGDDSELRCPTIPIGFPDYEAVLRRSERAHSSFVLDRDRFLSSIVSFDGEEAATLKLTAAALAMSRDGVEQCVEGDGGGTSVSVAVNPRFALDAAEHAVGNDLVIEIDNDVNPIVFRSADDGTYASLLMPIAID